MAEFASASVLQHFSHSHMLELTSLQGIRNGGCCRGCTKPIKDSAYHCQACNFFLQLSCSKIPQQISHPLDSHLLYLLTQPWNYAASCVTRCNACRKDIVHGFSFHCSLCSFDLHFSCAFLPTSSWSYHCSQYDYDSHVYCTQIHSLLNETSPPVNLQYADYATHPHYHSERSCSHNRYPSIPHSSYLPNSYSFQSHPLQQQRHPVQQQQHSNLRFLGNIAAASAISGISQAIIGDLVESLMNPGGDGGDWSGGFNENSPDTLDSMFNFGF